MYSPPRALDLLRLNTPRCTKTTFLTPKRYDEHPPGLEYRLGVIFETESWKKHLPKEMG